MRLLSNIFDGILKFGALLAAVIIILMIVGINVNIAMRYFFKLPIAGVTEVAEYGLLWLTLLGAAWVLKIDGHVRIDIIPSRFKPAAQDLVKGVLSAVCVIVMALVFWYAARCVWHYFQTGTYMYSMLEFSQGAVYLVIPIGTFLLLIQFLRLSYSYLLRPKASSSK